MCERGIAKGGATMMKMKKKGFTIAELLVAVAIIGILVAVSIPVFAGQAEKAKVAADMANVRSAKAAAVAQYLTDGASGEKTYYYDAAGGTVKEDSNGITGYGKSSVEVSGASGIPNSNGIAHVVTVKLAADGICSASWGTAIENVLQSNILLINAYTDKPWKLNDYLKKSGITLTVTTESLFGKNEIQNRITELTWRPAIVTINNKAGTVILYANDSSNTSAFAIYYNGETYLSTNNGGYQGRIDRNPISSFDIDASGNVTGQWKKE